MAAPKPEEISHPPMDQLQGLEYCIDSNPSWGDAIALGFQHYILALGTAVMIPSFLVPLMGGDHFTSQFNKGLLATEPKKSFPRKEEASEDKSV
ncbi:hypothetical protein GH714_028169 [Hevea brasiliensis]|uniref:Uncharacterized protein n=1 Tax=Hevea brasiliensis TaxID=3981 RepID=A0A6A6N5E9_HEVBR|nr:hypothetical protein GH714_028169 [Hevea brasiliensis]